MCVDKWHTRVGNLPRPTRSLRLGVIWIGSVALAAVALRAASLSAMLLAGAATVVVVWVSSDIDFALLGQAILGGTAEDLRRAQAWHPHFAAVTRWGLRFVVTYSFAWALVVRARLLLAHIGWRQDIDVGLPNLLAAGVLSIVFCWVGLRLLHPPQRT
jgi:hypothetical protein